MISKFLNSKFFSVVVILIVGWLALSLFGVESRKKSFDKDISGIESKINNVQKTNDQLSEFLSHFDNPSFLEKEARTKLNYKAPDEELILVYRDNGAKTASDSVGGSSKEGIFKSIFSKLSEYKNWFIKLFK